MIPRPFSIGFHGQALGYTKNTIIATVESTRFSGQRLLVPSYLGPDFVIEGIQINDEDLRSAWQGQIPAVAMSEMAPPFLLETGWLEKGRKIGIVLTNASGFVREFRAALIGIAED